MTWEASPGRSTARTSGDHEEEEEEEEEVLEEVKLGALLGSRRSLGSLLPPFSSPLLLAASGPTRTIRGPVRETNERHPSPLRPREPKRSFERCVPAHLFFIIFSSLPPLSPFSLLSCTLISSCVSNATNFTLFVLTERGPQRIFFNYFLAVMTQRDNVARDCWLSRLH
ncbi:hypothetical protein DMN91_004874 [Ooceraea biroi]|uniref:Uncharacterized protein n=1 Tax=Ooceraea biroi TaxID=2015173 RepID=A0A3L8DQN6_OOCBI|nr:hypothetical protein DMN91_004874 [Ooceraea biroi]